MQLLSGHFEHTTIALINLRRMVFGNRHQLALGDTGGRHLYLLPLWGEPRPSPWPGVAERNDPLTTLGDLYCTPPCIEATFGPLGLER